ADGGSSVPDQAEADVAGRAVGLAGGTGVHPVAPAVAGVAEVGAAPHDLVLAGGRAGGVVGTAPLVGVGGEPVGAPLPDVAGHLVQPVAVGRVRADRGGAVPPVIHRVGAGERPLPDVHAVLATGLELVAPRDRLLVAPPPGGVLPLGLGREPAAGPRAATS